MPDWTNAYSLFKLIIGLIGILFIFWILGGFNILANSLLHYSTSPKIDCSLTEFLIHANFAASPLGFLDESYFYPEMKQEVKLKLPEIMYFDLKFNAKGKTYTRTPMSSYSECQSGQKDEQGLTNAYYLKCTGEVYIPQQIDEEGHITPEDFINYTIYLNTKNAYIDEIDPMKFGTERGNAEIKGIKTIDYTCYNKQ